jgi:hypothetical protein
MEQIKRTRLEHCSFVVKTIVYLKVKHFFVTRQNIFLIHKSEKKLDGWINNQCLNEWWTD